MAQYENLIDITKLSYYDSKIKAKINTDVNAVSDEVTAVDGKVDTLTTNVNTNFVQKETGKGLFSGEYADLTGTPSNATTSAAGLMSSADKTKLDGMDTAISTAISAALGQVNHFKVVDSLPETGDKNAIYLIPKAGGTGENVKDEYCFIGGKWEHIGDTAPSLAGYVQETQISVATEEDIDSLFMIGG